MSKIDWGRIEKTKGRMQVVIRCDSSNMIGTGHVKRCLNIARRLKQNECTITFICRDLADNCIEMITDEFDMIKLVGSSITEENAEEEEVEYKKWLGCTQEEDVEQCIYMLNKNIKGKIDWVIVDHYALDEKWERELRDKIIERQGELAKILVIDDLSNRKHRADILIDSNGDDLERYTDWVSKECKVYQGPSYAPIEEIYSLLRAGIPKRGSINRIMISYGGIDKNNYTEKAVEALSSEDFKDLNIDIVLSTKSPNYESVRDKIEGNSRIFIYSDLPSLAGLMVRADLAIRAAGSTNKGQIRIARDFDSYSKNQEGVAKFLAEKKALIIERQSIMSSYKN